MVAPSARAVIAWFDGDHRAVTTSLEPTVCFSAEAVEQVRYAVTIL
jgi:hypothetical protein